MIVMPSIKPVGRPTVAEIDLGALAFNYRQIQKKIPKGVMTLGVVKADAYGHGAIPVSRKLEELGVEYLGVAMSDEGVQLRKGGIKTPILLLGGTYQEDVDRVFQFRLTPVVFQKESLQLLSEAAERRKKKVKVHLKVDTGMGRLGVPLGLWPAFLVGMKRFPNIEVEGILSHYSMADENDDPFTERQWKAFQDAVAIAESMGIHVRYTHISNSAGLAAFPSWSGNLVRPGIILYGSYPSPVFRKLIKLKPVMTLKTRIGLLKQVPAGVKISYGGTFVTKMESRVATLPIGYADGYNRKLSNQGQVLVRGRRAPVVGRVCMDYIIADVTGIPKVSPGDEVVLMGRQGREEITAEEVAERIGTISYEVFCLVGKRVPRVYRE
jgi:alanine racemase